MHVIEGRKGGSSSPSTPTESPDSLQSTSYAKILLALGEGEFAGELDGTRIFLDGTPLTSADGTENFPGVKWEFRPGTPHQDYIPGMPDVENEIAVSTELTSDRDWVRAVTNTQLSAVRLRFSWAQLQQQQDNGDVVGYRIEYAIDIATDGGAYQEALHTAIDGKTTTKYERSHRIDLPAATTGWQVRVRRLTPNSTSNRVADKMVVEAITETIDAKLRYPETALLFIQFDAKQFPNIPQVSSEPKGRIVRVPSNYNPETREYTGVWDGTFKTACTNNPAWITYDLMINDRFSIGTRVKAENLALTKWDLYQIGQYCDQLVPDGRGGDGKEPRFLCDVYIQSQEDAWNVLRDIASIYRGSTFWANNGMNALADMPADVKYIFTRANVKDGKFTYASASEKTHYSTCMVSWSDPANGYQDAIEPVAEQSLIRRYGIKQADLTAIGCIRKSEGIRRGKWLLHTNDKDRLVSFTVGLDGKVPLPGWIIAVADEMLAGRPLGGRISSVDGRNINLDRVSSAAVGERLILNLPSGKAEGRTIEAVAGKTVTVTTAYSEIPVAEAVWAVDASDLALQQFRVTGIKEGDDGVSFDITAVEHDPNKYPKIDTGARIEDPPISVIPPGVQPPPTNVQIGESSAVIQGLAVATLRVTWNRAESAIAYEAEWRRDNGNWIPAPRTSTLGFEVSGIYAGRYQARVRAINPSEISSVWANAPEMALTGKLGDPPALASFTTLGQVFGIVLNWEFPLGAEDTQRTEIWYSQNSDGSNKMHLGDYAYPQRSHTMTGLAAGVNFWFQARLVDKLGNTGPWTGWTQGTSSDDASEVLDYLKGKITETELGQELLGPVEDAGKLKDMWSVKVGQTVDGKLYTAGIGVGVENTPEGMQSQVLILADRFAVLNTADGQGSVVSVPFAIENNQVFINSAFIKDASITNAKIAEEISSSNYVWNENPELRQGWAINKNGFATFSNIDVVGNVRSNSGWFNNGTIGNCHILENCVIDGKLSAANIEGNLVQGNTFNFTISNTNGQRIIRYEGNPLMPMRIYGYVMAVMNRQQKTKIYFNGNEGTAVDGLFLARNGDSASSYAYTTMFSFSRDVGKGEGLDINVHAGDLNQGAGQSTKYTVMIWATPQNSGFSEIYP
ncbi:TipJ family phage tail tip protein [Serratia liquefaciens]|uniref:Host specificity protein J n=1 Tax=Serratia liquefaciens TaxID=614 RepID=A0A515D0M5_SERLI|nr:host specificity protein J [Serratia liquefaciens]QDL33969.1 host specificity protein J [Serratia liquefaciens]